MQNVNIHYAKTHLSKLLERVTHGEEVTIAKAGKPIARLVAIEEAPLRRIGLLTNHFSVPADFDSMGSNVIESMHETKS
jgi:prevent-host-death family protein